MIKKTYKYIKKRLKLITKALIFFIYFNFLKTPITLPIIDSLSVIIGS